MRNTSQRPGGVASSAGRPGPDRPATVTAIRHVEVWFGKEVIAHADAATAEEATHYATLMRRRWAGLRVTVTADDETPANLAEAS